MELARGVRSQLEGLVAGLAGADLTPMSLGLSHSLSRYKLKFSPDKVGVAGSMAVPPAHDASPPLRAATICRPLSNAFGSADLPSKAVQQLSCNWLRLVQLR